MIQRARIFLIVNYCAQKAPYRGGPGIDQSDIVLALMILLSNAGRVFGIDLFFAPTLSEGTDLVRQNGRAERILTFASAQSAVRFAYAYQPKSH